MDTKFAGFSRRDLVYSCINGHDLLVAVLTPEIIQERPPAQYPVLVHWHGGGFITGHRTYAPWWPNCLVPNPKPQPSTRTFLPLAVSSQRFLELALSHNAIIISPDHRLLPEANGTDVLADVASFTSWLADQLPALAAREAWPASPDLSRVATIGASSGGYLAMQIALLFPERVAVKAIISVCAPLNDVSSGTAVPRGHRRILGCWPPPPRQAEAVIREYIRSIKPGAVRSEGDPVDMWPMLLSMAQQGWLPRFLGVKKNPQLDLTQTLDKVDSIPPLWISHSEQDSIIPVECSTEFDKAVANRFPESPLLLTVKPGDHMWTDALNMSEPWVQEGCDFINQFWV
ncbi:hypothetical protein MMC08_002780 [Hypocenomyce scalaris]|nr:hypothetical protein [Hypocenomyce scalaris]